ncbi:MAG TPA: peptidylprolyl isomerase, partial [Solirubrobacterales bacterium]|nr:peptidylprolyl isomerase [Solirubrobacterales bacterium]
MRRGLALLAAGMTLTVLAGCKGTPPPLPPVPAGSGSILLPPGSTPVRAPDVSVVDRVVAVVNEDVILMSELQEAALLYLRDSKEAPPVSPQDRERLFQKVLDRMVDHRLQVQEARRDRVEITEDELVSVLDDFVKRNGGDRARIEEQLRAQGLSWDIVRRDIRDSLLATKVRARRIGRRATVTEAEVDAYLAENRPKLEGDLKYHPRHIAILAPGGSPAAWEKAKAEIDALAGRLREGADFAELARAHSQDGSAASGGDLGWLKAGELSPLFETPILKLAKGQTTAPIQSPNGYHLFRLEDREELTPEMVAQLRQQVR